MSDQNPTFDSPPPPPPPPAQPPVPPQATFGTAPGGAAEQVGAAPGVDQTIGTAPPPKKSPVRSLLVGVIGVVVAVAVLFGVGQFLNRDKAENAKVGDCLPAAATDNSSDDASDLNKVDCSSAEAATKVVGIVQGLNRAEFDAAENPCTQYATAESALWIGKAGQDGTTFCLEPVK